MSNPRAVTLVTEICRRLSPSGGRFTGTELHQERCHRAPTLALAALHLESLAPGVYPHPPIGCHGRRTAQFQGLGVGLLDGPALAGVGRFVEFVAVAVAALAAVDDQAAAVLRGEEELLN